MGLDYVSVLAGGRCPKNCSFCVGQKIRKDEPPHFADIELVELFLDEYSTKTNLCSISGSTSDPLYLEPGEPDDLLAILKLARKNGYRVSLHTAMVELLEYDLLEFEPFVNEYVLSIHPGKENFEEEREMANEIERVSISPVRISSVVTSENMHFFKGEFFQKFLTKFFTLRLNIWEPDLKVEDVLHTTLFPLKDEQIHGQLVCGDSHNHVAIWDFPVANKDIFAKYLWPDGSVNEQCYWSQLYAKGEKK